MAIEVATFDLETTGVDVETARIVTANITYLDADGEVVRERNWLVNPGVPIPDEASAVHGITDEIAQRDGVPPEVAVHEIASEILAVDYKRIPLVIYNAPYDLTVLDREQRRIDATGVNSVLPNVIDPLVIDKGTDKYRRGSRKLVDVAAHYGVRQPDGDAHEARYDAILSGRLAQILLEKLPHGVDKLQKLQVEWKREQAASFQKYLREKKGEKDAVIDGSWPMKPFEEG